MELTVKDILKWLELANEQIQTEKTYLTELDQAIGDGDHGLNMARGFGEVASAVLSENDGTIAGVLKDTAMTLISKVGGASGPLLGTAFLRMSTALKDEESLDPQRLSSALYAAVEGIKQRGKASEGEKTMLDVWLPVAHHFSEGATFDGKELAQVAKEALEATKDMKATKGRASYFGEKSIGHIDPGAATSYYLFSALAQVIEGSDV